MAAGTKYNLNVQSQPSEFYRVESGVRKSGAYKLKTDGIAIGTVIPAFAPVYADEKTREVTLVNNIKVAEDCIATAVNVKIAKGSLVKVGDVIGDGEKGTTVSKVDKSNEAYDVVTLKATLGAKKAGDILFEATSEEGTEKKNVANFVLFDQQIVEEGITLCTLLMQAYEVKGEKLIIPIHEKDREALTSRFQFDN